MSTELALLGLAICIAVNVVVTNAIKSDIAHRRKLMDEREVR